MSKYVFHVLPNAHLDPVWLWDWREGLNEGIITCKTVLEMMKDIPDLSFVRGESMIYRHIEKHDPETFEGIREMFKAGRWDIVGGTLIQADTNMSSTEAMCRQFQSGVSYFKEKFGFTPDTAWAADSFGHSAGLPEIYESAGIKNFAFTRPQNHVLSIEKSAFWWEGRSGARILCYKPKMGWYGSDRQEMEKRLNEVLANAEKEGLYNVAVFMGLGNHGGGPSRQQIEDLRKWTAEHPEIEIRFSGLHKLFAALREELKTKGDSFIPVHKGELNYCLRGCYASLAKYKYLYRKSENFIGTAEANASLLALANIAPLEKLTEEWDDVCFNSFHDILPGSSIERAYDEQIEWLGSALHNSRKKLFDSLCRLTSKINTERSLPQMEGDKPMTVPFVVYNPSSSPYKGIVEAEVSLDYRPIWPYRGKAGELPLELRDADGKVYPFQVIRTEHSSMPDIAWRKRVAMSLDMPPFSWRVMELGWMENPRKAELPSQVRKLSSNSISDGVYTVKAGRGAKGVTILKNGKKLFKGAGLQLATFEDPWGSWGAMNEDKSGTNCNQMREAWKVLRSEVLEEGPERAVLAVRMQGGASSIDLHFALDRTQKKITVSGRLLWNERSARLKILMPFGKHRTSFEVPGGVAERGEEGEVPALRWADVKGKDGSFLFLSESFYNFSSNKGVFEATICRASRYANDVKTAVDEDIWNPVTDCGELRFRFGISDSGDNYGKALSFMNPPMVLTTTPHKGSLSRTGTLAALAPVNLHLLSVSASPDGKGLIVRAQETCGVASSATLTVSGKTIALGEIGAYKIKSWNISCS